MANILNDKNCDLPYALQKDLAEAFFLKKQQKPQVLQVSRPKSTFNFETFHTPFKVFMLLNV